MVIFSVPTVPGADVEGNIVALIEVGLLLFLLHHLQNEEEVRKERVEGVFTVRVGVIRRQVASSDRTEHRLPQIDADLFGNENFQSNQKKNVEASDEDCLDAYVSLF